MIGNGVITIPITIKDNGDKTEGKLRIDYDKKTIFCLLPKQLTEDERFKILKEIFYVLVVDSVYDTKLETFIFNEVDSSHTTGCTQSIIEELLSHKLDEYNKTADREFVIRNIKESYDIIKEGIENDSCDEIVLQSIFDANSYSVDKYLKILERYIRDHEKKDGVFDVEINSILNSNPFYSLNLYERRYSFKFR